MIIEQKTQQIYEKISVVKARDKSTFLMDKDVHSSDIVFDFFSWYGGYYKKETSWRSCSPPKFLAQCWALCVLSEVCVTCSSQIQFYADSEWLVLKGVSWQENLTSLPMLCEGSDQRKFVCLHLGKKIRWQSKLTTWPL